MAKHFTVDSYFGSLQIKKRLGRNFGGEKQFLCRCSCGTEVVRTTSQLQIRKLQRCANCHLKKVEKVLARKERERSKKTKHAYYQSARKKREAQAKAQEWCTSIAEMSSEGWCGIEALCSGAQEA